MSLTHHADIGSFGDFNLAQGWEVRKSRIYKNAVLLGKRGVEASLIASEVEGLLSEGRDGFLVQSNRLPAEDLANNPDGLRCQWQVEEFKVGAWEHMRNIFEAFSREAESYIGGGSAPQMDKARLIAVRWS